MLNALVVLLLSAQLAAACTCFRMTECHRSAEPVIFIGRVLSGGVDSLRIHPWYVPATTVRFEVIEPLRGLEPHTKFVDLETLPVAGMCAWNPYYPGRTYLVSPETRDGKLTDGGCFSGQDVRYEENPIRYLRRYLKNPGLSIRGRVGAIRRDAVWLYDNHFDYGNGKVLQGVTVWTTAGGERISTITDAQGRYELPVPEPGYYDVQADLAPYPSRKTRVGAPRAGGCTVHNLGLVSNSSISGRVRDPKGRPLKKGEVGLIDLDRPPLLENDRVWSHAEDFEPSSGQFHFQNVPLGRYLLVFNPNGPHQTRFGSDPRESTYYPNGATRAQAQTIEIKAAGMHVTGIDLIAGPPVALRPVSVEVRFPDGAPMTTASILIEGEPIEPGGRPWLARQSIWEEQTTARFHVPVNRKFRISVTDSHGRDLNKVYESTHLPASSPIHQRFTVDPAAR
ncbi:MAG: carboxypeptidase-like regulatory domain-containing protein [Bryobacteraceae bacterium]|nr:hypothetical protein [Bryobacteraceae bacterium]MCO5350257.1 carboxypeptidase-like regulatory domain-containing protein [Bryobacteraceae bacterium]